MESEGEDNLADMYTLSFLLTPTNEQYSLIRKYYNVSRNIYNDTLTECKKRNCKRKRSNYWKSAWEYKRQKQDDKSKESFNKAREYSGFKKDDLVKWGQKTFQHKNCKHIFDIIPACVRNQIIIQAFEAENGDGVSKYKSKYRINDRFALHDKQTSSPVWKTKFKLDENGKIHGEAIFKTADGIKFDVPIIFDNDDIKNKFLIDHIKYSFTEEYEDEIENLENEKKSLKESKAELEDKLENEIVENEKKRIEKDIKIIKKRIKAIIDKIKSTKFKNNFKLLAPKLSNGKYKTYIQITCPGKPPRKEKHTLGIGRIALDLNVKKIAILIKTPNKTSAHLMDMNKINMPYKELRRLQRHLDRQKRKNNPHKYNENGTIKKGNKEPWNITKGINRTKKNIAILHHNIEVTRKNIYGNLANELRRQGDCIIIEKTNKKGWQKLYGKAIGKYAPGILEKIIHNKFESTGGKVILVDVFKSKPSQRCPQCRQIAIDKEKRRANILKCLNCGFEKQRDLWTCLNLIGANDDGTLSQISENFGEYSHLAETAWEKYSDELK